MTLDFGIELWIEVVLLGASACSSAFEAAIFSLEEHEARELGPTPTRLLEHPRRVLSAILVVNLTVNTLFFAFAASSTRGASAVDQWAGNLLALVCVVVLGEIVPKTLALRARRGVVRLGAPVMAALVTILDPLRRWLDRALDLIYRAIGPAGSDDVGITTEALASALDRSAKQGVLLDSEAALLAAVVELEEVRVRHVMLPRVDMPLLDLSDPAHGGVLARAVQTKAPWLIVVDGTPDNVLGRVRTRALLTQTERPVLEMIEPCKFVPEVASALAALQFLRDNHVAQSVVIDEWGGTAGLVSIEHIVEELVGDLRVEGEVARKPVVELERGNFEVDGSLSIRDWNEFFRQDVVPGEFETVGGLATALIGRMPRVGDVVRSGPLVFTVREMSRRRITRLEVRTEGRAEVAP